MPRIFRNRLDTFPTNDEALQSLFEALIPFKKSKASREENVYRISDFNREMRLSPNSSLSSSLSLPPSAQMLASFHSFEASIRWLLMGHGIRHRYSLLDDSLEDGHSTRCKIYACSRCFTPLFTNQNIISHNFTCQRGGAILVHYRSRKDNDHNTQLPPLVYQTNIHNFSTPRWRLLRTGYFVINYVYCYCGRYLGWSYDYSFNDLEKYKQGAVVVELEAVEIISDP